jgi:hypothetical protein
METHPKDLGAVVVAGNIKYELLEHDADHVELRNILQADQYIVIDLEALPGIASILNKAARELEVIQARKS